MSDYILQNIFIWNMCIAHKHSDHTHERLSMRWCYYMSELWNYCKNLFLCSSHSKYYLWWFLWFCSIRAVFFSYSSLSTDEANGIRIRNFNYYRMKSLMKYGTRNMFIPKSYRIQLDLRFGSFNSLNSCEIENSCAIRSVSRTLAIIMKQTLRVEIFHSTTHSANFIDTNVYSTG